MLTLIRVTRKFPGCLAEMTQLIMPLGRMYFCFNQ